MIAKSAADLVSFFRDILNEGGAISAAELIITSSKLVP